MEISHCAGTKSDISLKVVHPRQLDLRQKLSNFAFNNRNIFIEGLIWKRKKF